MQTSTDGLRNSQLRENLWRRYLVFTFVVVILKGASFLRYDALQIGKNDYCLGLGSFLFLHCSQVPDFWKNLLHIFNEIPSLLPSSSETSYISVMLEIVLVKGRDIITISYREQDTLNLEKKYYNRQCRSYNLPKQKIKAKYCRFRDTSQVKYLQLYSSLLT